MKSKISVTAWKPLLWGTVMGALAISATQAQVVQQWTHSGSPSEASTAVAWGGTYMWVADNEDEVIRLYLKNPGTACAAPVHWRDFRPNLQPVGSSPEADLEASAVAQGPGGQSRIYWMGGHGNSVNAGNARPNRNRFFATAVTGNGSGTPPYDLTYLGRYDHLRDDLIAWDQNNLHGKGNNYYGLAASAAPPKLPGAVDGFNIEGLALAPDGKSMYIGFRTPLINDDGASTSLIDRTNALIVPLLNFGDLVTASPVPGPGVAQFGTPIELFLGRRGIRSIDGYAGGYVIVAGAPDAAGTSDPTNFRLYTWSGQPDDRPVERSADIPAGYRPEGIVSVPFPLTDTTPIQLVSDDENFACFTSFTVNLGYGLPILTNGSFSGADFQFTVIGRPNYTYSISRSDNGAGWLAFSPDLTVTIPSGASSALATDPFVPAGTFSRRYRAATTTTGYSRSGNALGFERMTAQVGYNIVGNQFDNEKGNSIHDIFDSTPPDGTTIHIFDDVTDQYQDSWSYFSGFGWFSPTATDVSLAPGMGFWIELFGASPYTFSFIGKVPEGKLSVAIPDGSSLRSSKVAQAGGIQTVLGFSQTVVGDKIHKLIGPAGGFNVYTKTATGWTPSEPVINIGEGFFVERPTWTRAYKAW